MTERRATRRMKRKTGAAAGLSSLAALNYLALATM